METTVNQAPTLKEKSVILRRPCEQDIEDRLNYTADMPKLFECVEAILET